ncbi:hypothetical protein WJX75_009878 [Coccomyxa subellipsoidea]|uniref:Uncharacterized protein n=1 Tax=Coccomyxa subellipsoidea TaxID=248742 RepID=A0ABR2YKB9_9CHLO
MFCFGGVCVPLNLLLPFLIGVLHRYGFLQWVNPQWVTLRYWQQRWSGSGRKSEILPAPGAEEAAAAGEKGKQDPLLQGAEMPKKSQ